MDLLVLMAKACIGLAFWSFCLSRMWRWFVVPKFKVPELDVGDFAWLIMVANMATDAAKGLSDSTSQLASKIATLL